MAVVWHRILREVRGGSSAETLLRPGAKLGCPRCIIKKQTLGCSSSMVPPVVCGARRLGSMCSAGYGRGMARSMAYLLRSRATIRSTCSQHSAAPWHALRFAGRRRTHDAAAARCTAGATSHDGGGWGQRPRLAAVTTARRRGHRSGLADRGGAGPFGERHAAAAPGQGQRRAYGAHGEAPGPCVGVWPWTAATALDWRWRCSRARDSPRAAPFAGAGAAAGALGAAVVSAGAVGAQGWRIR
ncbi:uncharacterized protein BDZ99DRAFT_553747 [Mytilinidion resinicola]|uniref:Uncharacterized protein n=1 Tax=Mytilinidion resinicola TaxID=574789 RepID=A0A6A6Z0U8_9PEZI|nr:uncharacterized protein BDZ99DRAFT_553747 [Mytilinidion resinicola]KAF2813785.1 hypothetical protein BDZ99DRAFT_553747 [Mytilinidion resinicola]